MNRLLVLFFLLIFGAPAVFAQAISEDEMKDLLNSQEIQIDNPIISNFLMIRQISSDNKAVSIQQFQSGAANSILIDQNGTGNNVYVFQNGSGHESRLTQAQSANEASLWSLGEQTTNKVVQVGENNVVRQYIENYTATLRSVLTLQNGFGNQADLVLLDRSAPNLLTDMKLEQQGNQNLAELVISQGNSPSLTVTQTGGAEIRIVQSDFYFPMK